MMIMMSWSEEDPANKVPLGEQTADGLCVSLFTP